MDTQDKKNIQEIFQKQIKVEPKVMAIQTMFNNPRRLSKTNYKPSYQRNYVWDNEKATYFIESIILGTEIPPLIFFKSGENIEVIDGRQRYETIFNFVKSTSKQKLTQKGLLIFNDLKNKKFDDLDIEIKNTFWETKLRSIEFSFINEVDNSAEEIVKREIFKRYNSGITPLKSDEIDKAKYLESDLNSYFKDRLNSDQKTYDIIKTIFHYDTLNIEIILKEIRKLLVLDKIPISYYCTQKDRILSKFYEFYFDREDINVEDIYVGFIQKINILYNIYKMLGSTGNRLIFECLFWAITIIELEDENHDITSISKVILDIEKPNFETFINKHISDFSIERNSFAQQIMKRHVRISEFFNAKFNVDFSKFLKNNDDFKAQNKSIDKKEKTDKSALEKFESLRLNKPDASSITIDDICRQMENSRFLIRPPYQRDEVINKIKSSAIIESIILGIKLPPIFIYKRKDGVSEVIDGQQRLLSIIGFIGNKYINEKGQLVESKKSKYTLNLKNGILSDLDRKGFKDLPKNIQNKILDFDLWVIEIDQRNNPFFEPVDLYLRLNSKPFSIKENTFEMWNSYIDTEIIDSIKTISSSHDSWFYLRKNNARMDNEDLITNIIYLFFKLKNVEKNLSSINSFLDIYFYNDKISVRIKARNDVSSILEKQDNKQELLAESKKFKENFLDVISTLLENESKSLSSELDTVLNSETKRTNKNFYILWVLIANVTPEKLYKNKATVKKEINSIIKKTNKIESRDAYMSLITNFWTKYS